MKLMTEALSTGILLAVCALLFASTSLAQDRSVSGVITSKSETYRTITVLDDETDRRRTYFLGDSTQIRSNANTLDFDKLKKGQTVTLRFNSSDSGRELLEMSVPSPDDIVDIAPIANARGGTLSGVITGTRKSARAMTIKDNETGIRYTLQIPEETRISEDGKSRRFSDLKKGDEVTLNYEETESGFVLASKRSEPEPTYEDTSYEAASLPKTASQQYLWLYAALSLLSAAVLLRLVRRIRH